jgi:hypothetical protein
MGSEGAYRGEDVRRMTPFKRGWTLDRIREMQRERRRKNPGQDEPKGPTVRGKPIPTARS